jgi:hypothetical protein
MFSYFSWAQFLAFTVILLAVYYCFIAYLYYGTQIRQLFFFRRGGLGVGKGAEAPKPADRLPMVHELVSELGLVIRQLAETQPPIPELLFAMKSKIKDFMLLEPTEYKGKINLYIAEELEIRGIHGIQPEDIENLWKA